MTTPLPSLQRRLLSTVALGLLTLALILTVAFGIVSSLQTRATLTGRIDTAMQVAWQSYNEGPHQLTATVQSLASLPAFQDAVANPEAFQPLLASLSAADFAAVIDADGRILAHTNRDRVGEYAPFPHIVDLALRSATVQYSTELIEADLVAAQMPRKLDRLPVPSDCELSDKECVDRGLVQVGAVPVHLTSYRKGVVMVGTLLNNTHHIPQATSARIPGSYLSIAAEGFRVSSNINTQTDRPLSTGGQQSAALLSKVAIGERYYGSVWVDGERHYVASDPIYNSSGQVVGALSIGVPPSGLMNYWRSTQMMVVAFALLSAMTSVLAALVLSRRLALPIVALQQDVLRLASAKGAHELELAASQLQPASPSLYSQEMLTLHNSLHALATSMVDLTTKTESYLKEVEGDKAELEALTAQLQESKTLLERKVEERTEELQQAVLELRQANALKSQFLATMSHELRTPLNSVIGFSQMMADELVGPLNPKQKEYLGHILSSARHLLRLISDILDLSRIEQGRLSLELQEVLLQEVVASAEAKVAPQVEAAGLTLLVESDPATPSVQADPARVSEVLDNLLSNAIKFTPEGGTIWVRLQAADGMALMEVEDTGIGIRAEDQEAVFNEFVQAESAYHRRFEGVGLGLPLSKKLVEMHGGRIELKSELGKGTMVRVYLPVRKGDAQ